MTLQFDLDWIISLCVAVMPLVLFPVITLSLLLPLLLWDDVGASKEWGLLIIGQPPWAGIVCAEGYLSNHYLVSVVITPY